MLDNKHIMRYNKDTIFGGACMANKRERKNYINYFQKWDGMGTLGIGMMAVGFLSIWLGFSFITYIIGVVGMVGGLAVFLYGSIGRAHEADLQNEARLQVESLSFRELEEVPHFRRRVPKDNIEEHVFEGYILQDGLYLKKKKNGTLCSSEYLYAKMLTLCDAFYIKTVSFSYVEEKKRNAGV